MFLGASLQAWLGLAIAVLTAIDHFILTRPARLSRRPVEPPKRMS